MIFIEPDHINPNRETLTIRVYCPATRRRLSFAKARHDGKTRCCDVGPRHDIVGRSNSGALPKIDHDIDASLRLAT